MSSRSQPPYSGINETCNPESVLQRHHYKPYFEGRGNKEESFFDDDEDWKAGYLEKEVAFKRINDELEKKTGEIFRKIEKYRYHESPSTRFCQQEVGQGDAPSNLYEKGSGYDEEKMKKESESAINSLERIGNLLRPRSTRSYFNAPRPSTSSINELAHILPTAYSREGSSELLFTSQRPMTANATMISFPRETPAPSVMSHTETSLRRIETPRPLEAVEEKHQQRLQKATESVLKCVQSKLVNYEQRLADMHLQYRQKIQENTMLESKVKAIDEDRRRLLRTVQTLQSTTDKFSKTAENSKVNLNLKAQAFASLKKEMDSLKKDLKQKNCMIQSLQTRLDRCTEENRRLKSQYQSTQLTMKQQHNEDKSSMEELKQRLLLIEHQKSSLQATVEKQAQLIKSLRGHKVSLTNKRDKHDQTETNLKNDLGQSDTNGGSEIVDNEQE